MGLDRSTGFAWAGGYVGDGLATSNLAGHTLADLARQINPIVRGWIRYYGAFYRTALDHLLRRINAYLVRWLRRKYQRLRPAKKALACWQRITRQQPSLFAHWATVADYW